MYFTTAEVDFGGAKLVNIGGSQDTARIDELESKVEMLIEALRLSGMVLPVELDP